MARNSGDLVYYATVAGIGFVGYKLALDGKLGTSMQQAALQIRQALNMGGGAKPGGTLPGGTTTPPSGGYSALMQQMIAANPINFVRQMAEWKAARKPGEGWENFRTHQQAIGAPDPGPTAPPEF